jgi:hypothetical protein
MPNKYEARVISRYNGQITKAECTCGDHLGITVQEGASVKAQEMDLMAAFGRHMNQKHRQEDEAQTVFRIVKEATEQD